MRLQFTEHKSSPLSVLLHSALGSCNPDWQGRHSVSKDPGQYLSSWMLFSPIKGKIKRYID